MDNQNQKNKFCIGQSQMFRNDVLAHLGQMIMEERRRRNLRLVVLAKEINVQVKTLECLELGRAPINWECLRRVIFFFNKQLEIRLEEMG